MQYDEPNGQNYIPLAPDFTSTGGVSFQNGMDFQRLKVSLFKKVDQLMRITP
jgi:hypothetical protein